VPINIKNREAEALVAELKAATGKGASELILELLRKEAERHRRFRDIEERKRRIDAITKRYAARLPSDPPTPDEIIGYDENGLPT
jgi:antitoxin VapB